MLLANNNHETDTQHGHSVCTREVDPSELNEMEQQIAEALRKNLRGFSETKVVQAEKNDCKLGTFVQFPEGWGRMNIQAVPPHEVAIMLKEQAGQLLQAAAELSGEPTPQLEIGQPFYEVCVDNDDYVSLMLMNCDSEEEALRRGSQFLTRLKHSERLSEDTAAA